MKLLPGNDSPLSESKPPSAVSLLVVLGIGVCASVVATAANRPGPLVLALIGALGVALLGYLVLHHFEGFLMTMLVIRPLLDLTKTAEHTAIDVTTLTGIGMVGASALWLLLNRRPEGPRQTSPLAVALAVFTAVSILAIPGAQQPLTAVAEVSRLLSGVLLFFVFDTMLARGMPIRRLLKVLLLAAVLPLIVPFIGGFAGIDVYHVKDGIPALRSTFFLSNNFAHFLAPLIVLGVAFMSTLKGTQRAILLAFVGVGVTELVLTVTRGAWLAVLIGVLVTGFIQSRRLFVVGLAGALLAYAFIPAIHERVTDLNADPDAPRSQSSLAWRVDHWLEIVKLAEDTPLIGIGPGMTLQLSHNEKTPHSDYVRAYVEVGILGLLAYLGVILSALYVGRRAVSRSEERHRPAAVGIFAFICGFSVASMGENLITTVSFLWYVMPMLAIVNRLAYPPSVEDTARPGLLAPRLAGSESRS